MNKRPLCPRRTGGGSCPGKTRSPRRSLRPRRRLRPGARRSGATAASEGLRRRRAETTGRTAGEPRRPTARTRSWTAARQSPSTRTWFLANQQSRSICGKRFQEVTPCPCRPSVLKQQTTQSGQHLQVLLSKDGPKQRQDARPGEEEEEVRMTCPLHLHSLRKVAVALLLSCLQKCSAENSKCIHCHHCHVHVAAVHRGFSLHSVLSISSRK